MTKNTNLPMCLECDNLVKRKSKKYCSRDCYHKSKIGKQTNAGAGRHQNNRGTPITGCWIWTGVPDKNGYGTTYWFGTKLRVHRAVYEAFYGPIPVGLNVCHTCDTPSCYRPDHLFLGTQLENIQDMTRKGRRGKTGVPKRTHCKHGHEFTEENTYVYSKNRERQCKTCNHIKYKNKKDSLSTGWVPKRK